MSELEFTARKGMLGIFLGKKNKNKKIYYININTL